MSKPGNYAGLSLELSQCAVVLRMKIDASKFRADPKIKSEVMRQCLPAIQTAKTEGKMESYWSRFNAL
jgi:hypothetical protein